MKTKLLLQYLIFWVIIFIICFTSFAFIYSLFEIILKLDDYSFSDFFKKTAFFWLNMSAAMATLVLIIEARNKRW